MPKPLWVKGMKTPNPNGRPKAAYVLSKEFADIGPKAKERLEMFMMGDAEGLGLEDPVEQGAMLKAILEIIDRWLGKSRPMPDSPRNPLEDKTPEETIEQVGEAVKAFGLKLVEDKA